MIVTLGSYVHVELHPHPFKSPLAFYNNISLQVDKMSNQVPHYPKLQLWNLNNIYISN